MISPVILTEKARDTLAAHVTDSTINNGKTTNNCMARLLAQWQFSLTDLIVLMKVNVTLNLDVPVRPASTASMLVS